MKTIKVSELPPGPQMDALVAMAWIKTRAPSWDGNKNYLDGFLRSGGGYNPSTNGGQAMEVQKEFGLDVRPHVVENGKIVSWGADWTWPMNPKDGQAGETPEIAICRAVIASRFGETVEVEE